jgi:hypothetical protein
MYAGLLILSAFLLGTLAGSEVAVAEAGADAVKVGVGLGCSATKSSFIRINA